MKKGFEPDKKLLFKHEVLRARLDIRDFFLKNTVREVYENIGQVLSLVRMQLAVIDSTTAETTTTSGASPGHLVGQSIKDLRAMCKSFYPDADIIKENGFTEAFENTLEILFPATRPSIKLKGIRKEVQPELKLIIFKMLLQMLLLIKETEGEFGSLSISFLPKDKVKAVITYTGNPIKLNQQNESDGGELTLQQRAKLIKASLTETKNEAGKIQLKLTSPLNYLYE